MPRFADAMVGNAILGEIVGTNFIAAITAAGDPPAPPAGYNGTAFVTGLQAANVAFRASVSAAQTTYLQALSTATTSAERATARAALETSVASAQTVRAAALTSLGTPPSKPGQPS